MRILILREGRLTRACGVDRLPLAMDIMEDNKRARKHSRQRDEVLSILQSTKDHPTAATIYAAARKKIPNISLGTVYRNLDVLETMGLLKPIRNGHCHDRYDGDTSPHYHLICDSCGAVLDMPMSYRPDLDQDAAKAGFMIRDHRLDFHGLCPDCALGEKKPHK